MKRTLLILIGIAAMGIAACTTVDNEKELPASAEWGDDLTLKQVVENMPVTVDLVPASSALPNGITKANTVGASLAMVVSWSVPESSCVDGCEVPQNWRIQFQGPDGEWYPFDYELPAFETDLTIAGVVTYSVEIDWATFKQWWIFKFPTLDGAEFLKVFKVGMPDPNHPGKWFENIVTFMVCPENRDLKISLVEAEANASSVLFMESGYELAAKKLFVEGGGDITKLNLPVTNEALAEDLPANEPIRFTIRTNFEGWGFSDDISIHHSNSSFCKITKLTDVPAGVEWRFKFAFEDLPLDKKAIEENGLFDYNDLVFYVDIMKNDNVDF